MEFDPLKYATWVAYDKVVILAGIGVLLGAFGTACSCVVGHFNDKLTNRVKELEDKIGILTGDK